jgi:hypothetical protein
VFDCFIALAQTVERGRCTPENRVKLPHPNSSFRVKERLSPTGLPSRGDVASKRSRTQARAMLRATAAREDADVA